MTRIVQASVPSPGLCDSKSSFREVALAKALSIDPLLVLL
jgi:hypothetical protein